MDAITFEQLPSAFGTLFAKVENIERLLQQKADSQTESDELFTIQQAAAFLKLSVPTLYGLVSRCQVPVNKRGKRLYFSKQDLTEWVKAGRKKTQNEIQAEANQYLNSKKRGLNGHANN